MFFGIFFINKKCLLVNHINMTITKGGCPIKIIAVQKDDDGNIMNVKTDNQEVLTLEQAIYQASQGILSNLNSI